MLLAGCAGATAAVAGMLVRGRATRSPRRRRSRGSASSSPSSSSAASATCAARSLAGVLVGTLSGVVSVVWSPAAAPLVVFSRDRPRPAVPPAGPVARRVRAVSRRGLAGVRRSRSPALAAAAVRPRRARAARLLPRLPLRDLLLDRAGDELEHPVRLQRLLQLRSGGLRRRRRVHDGGAHRSPRRGTSSSRSRSPACVGGRSRSRIGGLAFRLRSLRGEIFALLTLAVPFILASIARISPADRRRPGDHRPARRTLPDALGDFQDFLYLVSLAIALPPSAIAYAIQRLPVGLGAGRDPRRRGRRRGSRRADVPPQDAGHRRPAA